ncbi:MAG: hypothetical protein JKY55_15620 [Aliivibrio sp.]|uniref:hypothetical protein n=1 Tax=Aliivibrio sp. TaxID=1872443 RepID=UPI001A41D217|nr:hypothetical protein [Aliivibrio sp.]
MKINRAEEEIITIGDVITHAQKECAKFAGAIDRANMLLDKFYPNRGSYLWKHIDCYTAALRSKSFKEAEAFLKEIKSNRRHRRPGHHLISHKLHGCPVLEGDQ